MNGSQLCELCGSEAHQVHHKDNNHKNNAKENLQLLCTLCHAKVHGIEPNKSELKELVILRDRAIRIRNALDNQIRGFGRIEYVVPEHWLGERKVWDKKIKSFEKEIKVKIREGDYKVWSWLSGVKGIGEVTAAKLIAYIDIRNTPHVSSLWRYCGLDATHIKRTRGVFKGKEKGEKQKEAKKYGNPYLKKELIGILADNFVKQRTPVYREIYDREKALQIELVKIHGVGKTLENGKTTVSVKTRIVDGKEVNNHAHLRAKRKMVKIFLEHFWSKWREVEGLPVTLPYVQAKLGHKHMIAPIKVRAK